MHDFHFKNNQLYCESVRVNSVAKKIPTPFYLYSTKTLIDHYQKIRKAFRAVNPTICFSIKSNNNLAVLKILADQGAGFDIVSMGELKKALKVKADPKKIAFASVGKTEEEIMLALRTGILFFNVESLPELTEINRLAKKMNKKAPVALRINPDVDAATHTKITTGTLKNKFGIDLKTARRIFKNQKKYPHIDFKGLHIHIGSQITTKTPFMNALRKVISFVDSLKKEGIALEYFDMGGGMGINYYGMEAPTAKELAKAIVPLLQKLNMKIVLEPGRFIAGNAGIFVTKVLYLKDNGFKKFLIVDGGMNDLIRPAFYSAYHEMTPVKRIAGKKIKVDVVGPICESGDFFAKDRLLPPMKRGELLAIMSTGAYGHVMASNYNVRPRVAEVIVKGNRFAMARKKETYKDLFRGEKIPGFLK